MTPIFKQYSKKIILLSVIITFISFNSCKKETNKIENQFIRIYNLSETNFDTIIIEAGYSYSGYIKADTLCNLYPQTKSNFVKFENATEVLQFYLTTVDSTTNDYYEVWKYPSTSVDPMNNTDWTFTKGYYTYIITKSDSNDQGYFVSLWTYSVNEPED